MDYLSESRTSHGGGDLIASSSNFDLNDLGAGLGDAGLGNKSFQSMLSATSLTSGNASSSSKAVLAALRALQDKIRRLESERSQALDEVTQLRMQLKNQEIESEHQKQRDQLTTQKSLQDAKVSQERLQQEKTELEVRVQRMEDKIRLSQQSSEELQTKIRVLEDEKHSANLRIREMEHAHHQMEQQIKSAQIKEKDMANTLIWETKHHEEEVTLLNHRVSSLQEELTKISHDKGALDGRIVELDQLVGQLLALNESLVAQLSGKPWRALTPSVSSTKKVKKTSSKKTSTSSTATAPRVASLSTVSADISRSLAKKPATKHVDVNDIDQLKSLHKAYAKMASSLTRSLSPSKSPSRAGRKASSHHDLSEMSHSAASLGTSRGSTRLSRKKKTATAASSSSSAYAAAEETTSRSTTPLSSSHTASVRIPKPNVSFDASQLDASSLGHAPSRSYLTTQQIDLSQLRTPATAPSSSSYLASPSSSPVRATPPAEDLRAMINTLEDEFSDLNRQYRRLLSNVSAASTDVPESLNEQSIDARAQEIVKVIQKLHEKGEQLRVLKSPTK